jgi:hypothetical protein
MRTSGRQTESRALSSERCIMVKHVDSTLLCALEAMPRPTKIKELDPANTFSMSCMVASIVHVHQKDKGKKPYILHPWYLANQLLYDMELSSIAILHDAIENSDGLVSIELLQKFGITNRVLTALSLLTHDPADDYLGAYIPAICTNMDAITVKRKDLDHNSRVTRLKHKVLREKDLERTEKYHTAFIMLTEARNVMRGDNE